jgi:hypothetical protein
MKRRGNSEDLGIDGKIILDWTKESGIGFM